MRRPNSAPAAHALDHRFSPEVAAVLLCAQVDQSGLADLVLREGFKWERFWHIAEAQQVVALALRALSAPEIAERLPQAVASGTKQMRMYALSQMLALHGELVRLSRLLHAQGIPAVPLKGTHLAQRLYDALDARMGGDIDILVPDEHLQAARTVLRTAGYETVPDARPGIEEHSFHGVPFIRTAGTTTFVVELHWKLSNPRFVTVDYDRLWARVRSHTPDSEPLRPLPTEETLIFLAVHMPKHHDGALRLVADIDRLIRREGARIDWSYALQVADAWNARGLLYFALLRGSVLFGTPLPGALLQRLAPSSWRRMAVSLLAGPGALLQPPKNPHVRHPRFWLAYSAMLTPFHRSADACFHYMFSQSKPHDGDPIRDASWRIQVVARGVALTGLALASLVTEHAETVFWRRSGTRPVACRPLVGKIVR